MTTNDPHFLHARTLRSEIVGAPDVWLPRRAVLVEWLDGFLRRAQAPEYSLGATEAADLDALEDFLRQQHIPNLPA